MENTKKGFQIPEKCLEKRDPKKCVTCGFRTQCPKCEANCNHCFYQGLCTHKEN